MDQEYLSTGEFTRWATSFESRMREGFDRNSKEIANVSRGIHKRLDLVDNTVEEHGQDIAVLKDRDSRTTKTAVSWSTGISGVVALCGLLWEYFTKR